MKKLAKIVACLLTFAFCIAGILARDASADMGPKPSITIQLENMPTDNYLIDLLVYDETGENYLSEMNYNGEGLSEEEIKALYDINYDGWISESTRWNAYMLFPDCAGGSRYWHMFSYFGTPDRYKVLIINQDTGERKITDEIIRTDFDSEVTIDYRTMHAAPVSRSKILRILIALVVTVVVEVLIALLMKLKKYLPLIIITNLISNLLLQSLMIFVPLGNYFVRFFILEVLVVVMEFLVYKKFMKGQSTQHILRYTIAANVVTAALTFLI